MNQLIALLLAAAVLAACGQNESPETKPLPTIDELASNGDRLRELRQQCKTDRAALGEVLCNRVAEATRQRFFGDGTAPYTPPKDPPKF